MGPSAYHAQLEKDQLVEDRNGVKVVFAGGNVFHLFVEGAPRHIMLRGTKATFDRAEAERLKLYSEYQPIPYEKPDQLPPADPAETKDEPASASSVASLDKADGAKPPAQDPLPEPDADDPPADDDGDDDKGGDPEVEGATRDDPRTRISLEDGDYPVDMVAVKDVRAMLGGMQGRLDGFIGNPSYSRLAERVRATDGCCAPVFFGQKPDTDDQEGELYLVAGLETLGAAIHLGIKSIAVVIVPHETASVSQTPITAMFTAANTAGMSNDDDMVYRAYN